jgi:HK97 family phage major capsid protein
VPELNDVIKEVQAEIKRFGDDKKALAESIAKDVSTLRAKAEEVDTKAEATHEELKAYKASVLEKQEALEKQAQTFENTIGSLKEQLDQLSVAIKRPGVGMSGGDQAKRLTELLHFTTTRLAIHGELKHTTDVEAKADLAELEAYEKNFRHSMRLDKGNLGETVMKALRVGIDPDGGFLVTPAMSSRIIQIIRETSPLRQFATVETIGTDKLEMPRDIDDVGFGWIGEEEAPAETTTPQVGIANIPVHEMYAEPRATQKFLEDASINAEAWLAGKIGDRFARAEATAFMSGNGVNKPRGILSYPTAATADTARAWGTFEHIVSGHATLLTADALVRMPLQLKEGYVAGSRWLMNRLTVQAIMLLKDGEGRYLWQPSFTEGTPSSLLGFPVSMATDMPILGAGSLSVGFGDIGRTYTVVDRLGITTLRDQYTAKPFVKFYSRRRVGGDVVHFEAFKFIRTGA